MQPSENFTVPRRALDVEDFIDILRRHKGWIFGPFLLTLVASVIGVYLWPDSYDSVAVVKIVPQQVSQNMVQSSITNDLADRINSLATTVLSRNVLITIINNHDLYKSERKRLPLEDVVDNVMKNNIHVIPIMAGSGGRTVPAFNVEFSYSDRFMAQKVVEDVVARFIAENQSNRSAVTTETGQFFKDEADRAKKELEDLETKISQYRVQNNGRLPEQTDLNYRNLQTLNTNYQSLTNSKNRAEMDKLQLETNLQIEKAHKAELTREVPQNSPVVMKSERMQEIEREIQSLEDTLASARQRFKDTYPDVRNLKNRLELAKQQKADLQKQESEVKTPAVVAASPANRQLQMQVLDVEGNIQRFESAIQQRVLEIATLDAQIKQTQDSINKLGAQISSAPLGQQQYDDLLRQREIASKKYVDLDARLSTAELSKNLEYQGQGERLDLLDAASLPQYPTEPKRPMVIGVGAGLGLLLGVVIAAAREMKDTSLKNLKDVRAYTQMAILGSVPLLENDFVVRRRRRIAWLGWTTACLMAVVTMAGSIAFYYYKQSV
jgi:uncharacterized protein involved in exopolysaccharide biosynthesis